MSETRRTAMERARGRRGDAAGSSGLGVSREALLRHSGRALAHLYRGGVGHAAERGDGWWLVLSGSARIEHNWVAVADPAAAWLIPDLAAHVRAAGVPALLAVTQEVMVAAGEALPRSALDLAVAIPHLAARLDEVDLAAPATDATLALVGDEAGLEAACAALEEAFEVEAGAVAEVVTPVVFFGTPVRVTTACVDGRVVAAVMTWTADGLCYVCFAGTVPDARGRGYGRAVLVDALRRERARGARAVHLVASADGERLYRRVGLREVGLGPWLLHAIPLGATVGR